MNRKRNRNDIKEKRCKKIEDVGRNGA